MRSKEIERSLEKSTEKYFKDSNYRAPKSNNDIESNNYLIKFMSARSKILPSIGSLMPAPSTLPRSKDRSMFPPCKSRKTKKIIY